MIPLAKVFTVTKNETDLIEDFIIYHGKIFGFSNIIIIDNMSTCPIVKDVYSKYMKIGITVVSESRYDGTSQGNAFSKHMLRYKKLCTFLIGMDTDEFFMSNKGSAEKMKNEIVKYLTSLPNNVSKIMVKKYITSVPDPMSPGYIGNKVLRPATNIKTFTLEETSPRKYFFRADNFISTVNGCHNGKVTSGITYTTDDIIYAHFHNTGNRRSIERARLIVSGYKYTDTDLPILEQLEDMERVTSGIGSHRVLEYSIFLSKALCLNTIVNKGKWPSPTQLEIIAMKFPNLLGHDIDTSNMETLPEKWREMYEEHIFYDPPTGNIPDMVHCSFICDVVSGNDMIHMKTITHKRIAMMLSGHFRDFSPRKEFWINFNKKFGDMVDIYIHTWNEKGIRKGKEWIVIGKHPPDFELIRKILQPVKMVIEDHGEKFQSFSFQQPGLKLYYVDTDNLKKNKDFSRNIGSQLYSIMKCWELVRDSNKKYDILVRLRADCTLENFHNIFTGDTSFIENNALVVNGSRCHIHPGGGGGCKECNEEYITGKRIHSQHGRDICDIMYMGNPQVMERVCNIFKKSKELLLSFKNHNDKIEMNDSIKRHFVKYPDVIGITCPDVYENKIKCYYPERLIREYMKDYWVISDTLGLVPRIKYKRF